MDIKMQLIISKCFYDVYFPQCDIIGIISMSYMYIVCYCKMLVEIQYKKKQLSSYESNRLLGTEEKRVFLHVETQMKLSVN